MPVHSDDTVTQSFSTITSFRIVGRTRGRSGPLGPSWVSCPVLTPSGENCPGQNKVQPPGPLWGGLFPALRSPVLSLSRCRPRKWVQGGSKVPILPGLPSAPWVDSCVFLASEHWSQAFWVFLGLFRSGNPTTCFRSPHAQTSQPASVLASKTQVLAASSGRHRTPLLSVNRHGEPLQLLIPSAGPVSA